MATSVSLRDELTLPAIFLLKRGGAEARRLVSSVLADRALEAATREQIVTLTRQCGALDEARQSAESYAEAARRALVSFPSSPYREALVALPDFVLARES